MPPVRDRRAERHSATRDEILEAAWKQVRERGLAGLSLRDLAAAVGMRAPSLYSYFGSKAEIYDAMFAAGNREFLAHMTAIELTDNPAADLRQAAHRFVDFCLADTARALLLFQRTIPDFEPSPESYAIAVDALEGVSTLIQRIGSDRPQDVDLWTAFIGGLVTQQLSNDPYGDRWIRLVDEAVDMCLEHFRRRTSHETLTS